MECTQRRKSCCDWRFLWGTTSSTPLTYALPTRGYWWRPCIRNHWHCKEIRVYKIRKKNKKNLLMREFSFVCTYLYVVLYFTCWHWSRWWCWNSCEVTLYPIYSDHQFPANFVCTSGSQITTVPRWWRRTCNKIHLSVTRAKNMFKSDWNRKHKK